MESRGQEAKRPDLYEMLYFLERLLPSSCDIYDHLLFYMRTTNPRDTFYYLRHPSDEKGTFSAIVGLMCEKRLDPHNQDQKSWRISAWSTNPVAMSQLFRAIGEDKVINWDVDFVKFFLEGHEMSPPMMTFLHDMNRRPEILTMKMFYLSIEEALNMEISPLDEVYVSSLEPHHAQVVYDGWAGKDTSSVECMAKTISQLPSAGVFLKSDNRLVSWIVCHPPSGGLNHLWTLEEYRRRGYANLATKYLCKQLAQSGQVPFVIIKTENEVSQKFFNSFGFRYLRDSQICYVLSNHPDYDSYVP